MKIGWLLPLNAILWGASIPAMNYCVMALSAYRIAKVPDAVLPVFIFGLLLWAGFIYWRLVPTMQSLPQKIAALIIFLGAMLLIGLGGLWIAFVVAAATFGV
ncbi:MAG TPA: hypothetical protein VN280_08585 [Variovorax sp.]|nr:hypothetical protein [Variovorax sp.]